MTDPHDLLRRSALEIAEAIRTSSVSAREVTEAHLAAIERLNPALNAVCFTAPEEALEAARVLDERIAARPGSGDELPPFAGVPMLIKDLNPVAGWPTTQGSMGASDQPAPADGLAVARLREAGFIFSGKTTTPEFGTTAATESTRLGITRNPWNPKHTPGGSSGGAGAAVAAGMLPAAHGSDGGGSIRIPSSCNGLVGLKPSRHRITSDAYNMGGFSTQGVLTRTVADTAAIVDVLAQVDPLSWVSAPPFSRPLLEEVGVAPEPLRIRFTTESPLGITAPASGIDALGEAARALEAAGHHVEEGPLGADGARLMTAFLTIWAVISAGTGVAREDMEAHNQALFDQAEATSSLAYAEALLELQTVSREVASGFGSDFDLLLTPTLGTEPPEVGWLWQESEDDPRMPLMLAAPMAAYTSVFNITGLPAISLPVHMAESGLPVGVQLVAPPLDEPTLIRVAAQLEDVFGWQHRQAPI